MILVGILLTFLGFIISVLSLAATSSVGGRLAMVLLGLAVSLFGIAVRMNPGVVGPDRHDGKI